MGPKSVEYFFFWTKTCAQTFVFSAKFCMGRQSGVNFFVLRMDTCCCNTILLIYIPVRPQILMAKYRIQHHCESILHVCMFGFAPNWSNFGSSLKIWQGFIIATRLNVIAQPFIIGAYLYGPEIR